jgi:hypothetical protein
VAFAPQTQHLRVNPATVIADQNAQVVGDIFDLNLDASGTGVAERIDQRLVAYAVDFIAYDRVQRPWPAFDDDAKPDLLLHDEFLLNPGKRLFEFERIATAGA